MLIHVIRIIAELSRAWQEDSSNTLLHLLYLKLNMFFLNFEGKNCPGVPLVAGLMLRLMQCKVQVVRCGDSLCVGMAKHFCSSDALPIYFTKSCQKHLQP